MSNNWRKFSVVVIVLLGILFLYGLSSPEIRASMGSTSIITTFIGLLFVGYFIFRQKKQNKISDNVTMPKDSTAKLANIVYKICMVFVALIVVYLVYLLLTNK